MRKYRPLFIAIIILVIYLCWLFFMPTPINYVPVIAVGAWMIGKYIHHIAHRIDQYLTTKGY